MVKHGALSRSHVYRMLGSKDARIRRAAFTLLEAMGRMSPEFPSATQLPSKTQLQVLRLRIACRTRQTFPHHRRSRMRTRAHLCRSALKVLRRGTHIPPQRHIRSRTRSPERRIGVIKKLPSEWLVSLWAWTMGSGALAAHTRATPHIRVPVFGIGPGDHQRPVRGRLALATPLPVLDRP